MITETFAGSIEKTGCLTEFKGKDWGFWRSCGFVGVLFLNAVHQQASGEVITVSPGGDIQEAILRAVDRDTVLVLAGDYIVK